MYNSANKCKLNNLPILLSCNCGSTVCSVELLDILLTNVVL